MRTGQSKGEQETDAQRAARYERAAQERERLADQLDHNSQLLRRVTDCPDGPMPQEREAEGHRKVAWFLRTGALLARARAHEQAIEDGEGANVVSSERMGRTRVVHCQRERFDVCIGRSVPRYPHLRATGWGNPFWPAPGEPDARNAVARYRAWLMGQPQLLARLPELRGKTLGCWCAPPGGLTGDLHGRICHGEILAALADGMTEDIYDEETREP